MKLITFLGTFNYYETTYAHRGATHATKLFPVALCHFLRPSELLAVVTTSARDKWLPELNAQVSPLGLVPTPIDIPDGHSVDDLWEIFSKLTAHLSDGDNVVFDITNSFRTLPFLTFLAASYLRVALNVTLEGIYYGAYEARVPASNPPLPTDVSPVFDLSPFITLLDLTTATDQFLKTGNAQALAELLPKGSPLRGSVGSVASSLHVLRPLDVMQAAHGLPGMVDTSAPVLDVSPPPYAALMQRIKEEYGAFGLDRPRASALDMAQMSAYLQRLLDIVTWYLNKHQTVQALALAREWLPTRLCCHFGYDPTSRQHRDGMEDLLNRSQPGFKSPKSEWHKKEPNQWEFHQSIWQAVPQYRAFETLWIKLTNLRNDVLHCGFRNGSQDAATVETQTRQHINQLKSLAGQWKIEATEP